MPGNKTTLTYLYPDFSIDLMLWISKIASFVRCLPMAATSSTLPYAPSFRFILFARFLSSALFFLRSFFIQILSINVSFELTLLVFSPSAHSPGLPFPFGELNRGLQASAKHSYSPSHSIRPLSGEISSCLSVLRTRSVDLKSHSQGCLL